MTCAFSLGFSYPNTPGCSASCDPSTDIYLDLNFKLRNLMLWARTIGFTLAHVHVYSVQYCYHMGERADQSVDKRGVAVLVARLVVVSAVNVATAVFLLRFAVGHGVTETGGRIFGLMRTWNADWVDGSELGNCVMQVTSNASCINANLAGGDLENGTSEWMSSQNYMPWGSAINLPPWTPENRGY